MFWVLFQTLAMCLECCIIADNNTDKVIGFMELTVYRKKQMSQEIRINKMVSHSQQCYKGNKAAISIRIESI